MRVELGNALLLQTAVTSGQNSVAGFQSEHCFIPVTLNGATCATFKAVVAGDEKQFLLFL